MYPSEGLGLLFEARCPVAVYTRHSLSPLLLEPRGSSRSPMPGIVAVARLWLTIGITWFLISFLFLHLFSHTQTTKIAAATNTNRWDVCFNWHWAWLEEVEPCGQWLSCTFWSVSVTEFQNYFDSLQASAAHRSLWETNIWPGGHWGQLGA